MLKSISDQADRKNESIRRRGTEKQRRRRDKRTKQTNNHVLLIITEQGNYGSWLFLKTLFSMFLFLIRENLKTTHMKTTFRITRVSISIWDMLKNLQSDPLPKICINNQIFHFFKVSRLVRKYAPIPLCIYRVSLKSSKHRKSY